ncbi:MAG: type VI secretion system baseplate subunit TssG [Acidobacteriota bacterium]|nr:type VI secretion system baseplate subunit TssG [Acidobacteriota bacterium]
MAAEGRPRDPDLKDASRNNEAVARELHEAPYRFAFFQAVRLLERLLPHRKPVGYFDHPSEEVARFGAYPTLSFPASEIQSIEWPDNEAPRLAVNFMGLTGAMGLLPLYYTEFVMKRLREGDTTLRDFLDIFNHRMISLFYRAWEKYRFAIAYERGGEDRFTHYLKDLIGIGTAALAHRQALPDDALLYYAGLLAQKPRSAASLRQVLSDYFGVDVEIEQFAGAWYRLDRSTLCEFGDETGLSQQLGMGAVVGDEIWTQESRVRIKLGPLELPRYLEFLPGGGAFESLRTLTRFFSNDELDFEVQLILKREDVPQCELGAGGDQAPRLGWLTWVKTAPLESNALDAVLEL